MEYVVTYLIIGVFYSLCCIINPSFGEGPDDPQKTIGVIVFLFTIMILWPVNVAFNLYLTLR